MKTLLLTLLLVTSAAQADQWLVNGRTYKGTIHKFSPDRARVWVTSDWDNYGGSWVKVAELDSATRVRLNIATPQEQVTVRAQMQRAAAEQEQNRQIAAQAEARAIADRTARIEQQKIDLQRQQLEFQRRQEAHRVAEQQRRQASTQIYIIPIIENTTGQGFQQVPQFTGVQQVPGIQQVPGYQQVPHVHHAHHVPQVPRVPAFPQYPQVQQPIIIRSY